MAKTVAVYDNRNGPFVLKTPHTENRLTRLFPQSQFLFIVGDGVIQLSQRPGARDLLLT